MGPLKLVRDKNLVPASADVRSTYLCFLAIFHLANTDKIYYDILVLYLPYLLKEKSYANIGFYRKSFTESAPPVASRG
jgi:hypothetical protein